MHRSLGLKPPVRPTAPVGTWQRTGAGPDSKTERAGAQNAEPPCGPLHTRGSAQVRPVGAQQHAHQTYSQDSGPSISTQLVRSGALFGARLLAPLVAAGLAAGGTLNAPPDTMTQSWNASHPVP